MNTTLKYLFAASLAVIIGVLAWLFLAKPSHAPTTGTATTTPALPSAGSVPASGGTASGGVAPGTTVTTQDGTTLSVQDFTSASDVVSVPAYTRSGVAEEPYYSLGSLLLGEATSSGSELPTALTRGYEMLYFPDEGAFSIFIYREPIGAMRLQMAQDLARRLGITQAQLCSLVAYVRISPLANQSYVGENVGFPGCPGAVDLPTN